jgi:glycosyltransferase involved in cell wall biosynthesis
MVRHDETGLIVPPDDPEAMAAAVASLLEAPARAQELSERARQETTKFSWPAVRQAWAEVYGDEPLRAGLTA